MSVLKKQNPKAVKNDALFEDVLKKASTYPLPESPASKKIALSLTTCLLLTLGVSSLELQRRIRKSEPYPDWRLVQGRKIINKILLPLLSLSIVGVAFDNPRRNMENRLVESYRGVYDRYQGIVNQYQQDYQRLIHTKDLNTHSDLSRLPKNSKQSVDVLSNGLNTVHKNER